VEQLQFYADTDSVPDFPMEKVSLLYSQRVIKRYPQAGEISATLPRLCLKFDFLALLIYLNYDVLLLPSRDKGAFYCNDHPQQMLH
jgi:hypothetical protein